MLDPVDFEDCGKSWDINSERYGIELAVSVGEVDFVGTAADRIDDSGLDGAGVSLL